MKPRRRFGQHFLNPSWAARVIASAGFTADDRILEIGPGRGALTIPLSGAVAELVAVEIDRDLAEGLRKRLPERARLIEADFLNVRGDVLFDAPGDRPWRVVGNLPYNVSSPILFRLLELARGTARLTDATLMLQREVADRVASAPGTKQYGALSIMVQLDADVEGLLTLPPGAFRPAPQVWSKLIRLRFRPPRVQVRDRRQLEVLVKSIFAQRRKMLANALRPLASSRGRDSEVLLRGAGIDPTRRPETLHLAELARLADALGAPNPAGEV